MQIVELDRDRAGQAAASAPVSKSQTFIMGQRCSNAPSKFNTPA